MSRLPLTNGDANNWGTILNDFLQQSLNSDGTLVTSSTNSWTSTTNTNLATTGKPGLVQLAGDLSNTSTSPTVSGIQGRSVDSTAPTDGQVLSWSASSSQWVSTTVSGTGSGGLTQAQSMAITSIGI